MRRKFLATLVAAGGLIVLVSAARPEATEFYHEKTVEILAHVPPGGSYDLHSRLLARHMRKHVPGNPTMIVKNMPGGGGLIQANHLFRRAKQDGTTIGILSPGVARMEALGQEGIQYESRRFSWIGRIADAVMLVTSRSDAPIKNLNELLDPEKNPLRIGASAPPSDLYVTPAGLNLVFEKMVGRPLFKLVAGYAGVAPLRLALEGREVDGLTWTWDTIKAIAPHYLEPAPGKGFINLIGHVSLTKERELEGLGVPSVPDRLKDSKGRAVLDFLMAPAQIQWAAAAPPGVPQDRLKILREAFMKTLSDPEYLAEIRRLNLTVNPLPGEQVEKIVRSTLETPREVVDIARGIFQK